MAVAHEQGDDVSSGAEGQSESPPKKKRGETPRQQIRKAKKATRRRFSAEDKIRIVMEGIRGEDSVSALCPSCSGPEAPHSTVYSTNALVSQLHSQVCRPCQPRQRSAPPDG